MRFTQSISILGLSLLLLLSGCVTALKAAPEKFAPGAWCGTTLVKTGYGLVEGLKDREKTIAWKGIPYAKPPVGDLRWKAPREPEPWEGIRHASAFGNPAVQNLPLVGAIGSEDCLSLNVWRPESGETSLPVYVYIHGGGNTIGTTLMPEYSGYAVASRSRMVYVSINYRLGVMGWFRHESLVEGKSPEDDSGNYGTLDIIQSLKWIQENISAFGGDPGRVTVSGESAGGMNILSLLLSPLATGLFQGAVIQSGYTAMPELAEAEEEDTRLLRLMLFRDGKTRDEEGARTLLAAMGKEETAAYLRSKSPASFMRELDESPLGLGMSDYPTIYPDGYVIPKNGFAAFADGSYAVKVPLVIGSTKDEHKLFMAMGKDAALDRGVYEAKARVKSEAWRYHGVDTIAETICSFPGQPPVYAYRFDWGSPDETGASPLPGDLGRKLGAFHSIEVPFFLGTDTNSLAYLTGPILTEANRKGRESLTAGIMAYLSGFARTRNPNSGRFGALPEWVPWSRGEGGTKAILFDVSGDKAKYGFLSSSLSVQAILDLAKRQLKEPYLSAVMKTLGGTRLE